jgi:hypothetical protein
MVGDNSNTRELNPIIPKIMKKFKHCRNANRK